MKLMRLIKMSLAEMYSRFWVGKNLSDMFLISNGLKQGEFKYLGTTLMNQNLFRKELRTD
jgi:hypothetical protein